MEGVNRSETCSAMVAAKRFHHNHRENGVRVSGIWKQVMHGPDGTNYPNSSVFLDIVEPEHIVYSHSGGSEEGPGANYRATWTFDALGEQTRLTMHLLFNTPEERNLVIKEYGAIEGGKQTLARLAEYLPKMAA